MMHDRFKAFRQAFVSEIRADAILYLAIAAYAAVGIVLLRALDASDHSAYALYVEPGLVVFGVMLPLAAFVFDTISTMVRFRKQRERAYRRVFSPQRLARFAAGLCLLQAMTLFFGTFTSIKNILPVIQGGFPYDIAHANIDAALHFGQDPWRIINAMWGNDAMRALAEWNYNVLWFLICYGALFFVATSPRTRHLRVRYVIGFMLVWVVVGNALAGAFLSAGPAFYGYVTGDTARFADQLHFLARGVGAGYSAAGYQSYLWMLYDTQRTGFGSGISAFPSVHVALISFNALTLVAVRPKFVAPAFLYVGFVLMSSVFLAWHYAIDGYVGVLVAGLIFAATSLRWRPEAAEPAGLRASAAPLPR